ncbi:MAG: hypothetical protein U1F98_15980 [Verrucomicrobiota bacterium]
MKPFRSSSSPLARRRDGSAVIILLVILFLLLVFVEVNSRTAASLHAEVNRLEQRQLRRLTPPAPGLPASTNLPAIKAESPGAVAQAAGLP